MKVFCNDRAQAFIFVCAMLISLIFCSCGILPKINTDPENRTHEVPTEAVSSVDPSAGNDITETTEDETEPVDSFEQTIRDRLEMQEAFHRFFDIAYDQYLQLADADLSAVLDMSSEECIRLEEDLKRDIEERRTSVKNGTSKMPEKLPYEITVIRTFWGGSREEGQLYGEYSFLLKPTAERGSLSDEEYLEQYPSFLSFGMNSFSLQKTKVGEKWEDWKINHFFVTDILLRTNTVDYEGAVRKYYEEAWRQYTDLEYTGLQEVMDETSPDYTGAEETLKSCIAYRTAHPEGGTPVKLDYKIRVIEKTVNPPGNDWSELGTIRFELEPIFAEGKSEEEVLKNYPAFMTFGEHCWSISVLGGETATDKDGIRYYESTLRIKQMDAAPVEGSSVRSIVNEEMEETVQSFFKQAYTQYILMEETDLSDVLDMASDECVKVVEELKKAINKRKEDKAAGWKEEIESMISWLPQGMNLGGPFILACQYESTGGFGEQDNPRRCIGICQFEIRLQSRQEWEEYYKKLVELPLEERMKLQEPQDLTREECEECIRQFLPCMSYVNAVSFNWNDGTCKIDGFDASEWFDAAEVGQ